MEYSKKDIIVKLINQIYTQVDTIRELKEEVKDLEDHKLENPDSYELTLQNDKLIKENKNLSNTVENLRNELKILRNGKR